MNLKEQISEIAPRSAIKNVSFISAGKFCQYVSGFLYTVFAARLLGAAGYGQLCVVMATVYLFTLPFDFKFSSPLVKLIGERINGKRETRVRAIVQSALILQFISAFLFGLVFLLFLLTFSENYQLLQDWSTALGLFGLSEILHRPRTMFTSILTGLQAYKCYTLSAMFVTICRDIVPIIFMFSHGIVGACFGYLVAEIINLLFFTGMFIWLEGPTIILSVFSIPEKLKQITKTFFYNSRSNYLASICKRGYTETLQLILGGLTGTSGVGYYKIGRQFKKLFTLAVTPVSTYLYPRLVEKWSQENKTEFFYTLRKYFYLIGGSGLSLAIVLSATTPWLIPLFYGKGFLPSIPVVWIILPAAFITQLLSIFPNIAFTVSEQRTILNVAIFELLVGLPLVFLLVYNFGYLGAAWAFALKIYITSIYKISFFYKKFGWQWILPV